LAGLALASVAALAARDTLDAMRAVDTDESQARRYHRRSSR
jgi:hypothetical protein